MATKGRRDAAPKASTRRDAGKKSKQSAKTATTSKRGRPPKIVLSDETLKQIGNLAKIHCTEEEAAAFFEVNKSTFCRFLQRHKTAKAAWENGSGIGKASLRRLQFKAAEAGNATMMIWLGKQYLGQRDKADMEHSGKNGGPIPVEFDADAARKSIFDKLQRIRAAAGRVPAVA